MKSVPAVSSHLSSKHTKNSSDVEIYHIKIDRKDPETVTVQPFKRTSTELNQGPGEKRQSCLSGVPCDSNLHFFWYCVFSVTKYIHSTYLYHIKS